jgi:hypothetical protein
MARMKIIEIISFNSVNCTYTHVIKIYFFIFLLFLDLIVGLMKVLESEHYYYPVYSYWSGKSMHEGKRNNVPGLAVSVSLSSRRITLP